MNDEKKPELYTKYPLKNVLIYNGTTVLHFLIGTIGIIIGYSFLHFNWLFGMIYLVFAFGQMYIMMPLVVCPNCVYYRMEGGRCTSGLNILSRKIAKQGDLKNFGKRAEGLFSHNKMYMGSLFAPIAVLIPALILNFTLLLLILFILVIILLMFRFVIVFQKTACIHCRAKKVCPNAKAMGLI